MGSFLKFGVKFHLAPLLLLPFLTLELNAAFRTFMAFMTSNPGPLNVFEYGYMEEAAGRYIMMGYSEMKVEYNNGASSPFMSKDVFAGGGAVPLSQPTGF